MKFGIIGSGSWGTAIAKILTDNGQTIYWWNRSESSIEQIKTNFHNPQYLSSAQFNINQLKLSSNLEEVIRQSDVIVIAVPSAYAVQVLSTLPSSIFKEKKILSAIKGILPEQNLLLNDYLIGAFDFQLENYFALLGPCHAEEVAAEKLSYLTVAANTLDVAQLVKGYLEGEFIRVWCSADLIGAEYSAVMKNIYAIGAGIAHGLGYGDNFLALYTSCAIREMKVFLQAIDPSDRDVDEAAYLGDLLVTCYSQFSRNRTFGNMLGKGYSVKAAQLEMNMVAEGYYASNLIYNKSAKRDLQLPIADAVYRVIYENANAKKTFKVLSDHNLH